MSSDQKGEIAYDDFLKVDLRVGTVISASRVPKSGKMLQLEVSFGDFTRQILAGIGKTYQPEDLLKKQFLFVVNLAPRPVMSGLVSHGMILATGDSDSLALTTTTVPTADGSPLG